MPAPPRPEKWKAAITAYYNEHSLLPGTLLDIRTWFLGRGYPDNKLKNLSKRLRDHGCKYRNADGKWHCRKDYVFERLDWRRKKKADYTAFKKAIVSQTAPGKCMLPLLTLGANGQCISKSLVDAVLREYSKDRSRSFQARKWVKGWGEDPDKHKNLCGLPHYFMVLNDKGVQLHTDLWTTWKLVPRWLDLAAKK